MKCLYGLILAAALTLSAHAQTNTNSITFPILLSANNEELMTNATFKSIFGTKVMFVSGLSLRGFDLIKLNPSVIKKLGISPTDAAQKQAKIDANKARTQYNDALQNKALVDAYSEAIEVRQKAEQDKAIRDAAIARANYEEGLRIQALNNDTMKAQAAKKAADAAWIQAQNPTVIQQSTTVFGR
jgi:hypothetical protein